ncbi:hypothetical protein JTB14_002307 [Gonioctena quinquepunctata]|nr:hypothetical protein JTB14_002307 [Gonioctena quinquepunctata]
MDLYRKLCWDEGWLVEFACQLRLSVMKPLPRLITLFSVWPSLVIWTENTTLYALMKLHSCADFREGASLRLRGSSAKATVTSLLVAFVSVFGGVVKRRSHRLVARFGADRGPTARGTLWSNFSLQSMTSSLLASRLS